MLLVFVRLDLLGEIVNRAVAPYPDIAGLAGILKDLLMLALFTADNGGHNLDAGGLGQGQNLIDNLVDGLLLNLLAALGAVGSSHPCPQKAQIVVYFGDGTDGGAGIFAGGLLVDGDGGGETVNIVYIGLLHLPQKHTGIRGQRLHITPLSLCVDGVKGQRRLAGAAEAGEDHQLVPGDLHVDVFQVVGPGAFDGNVIKHTSGSPLAGNQ